MEIKVYLKIIGNFETWRVFIESTDDKARFILAYVDISGTFNSLHTRPYKAQNT